MSNATPQRIIRVPLSGNNQIVFDEDKLTNKTIRQFRLDVANVLNDYDKEIAKIQDDFNALLDKHGQDIKRRDGEADDVYDKRIAKLTEKFKKAAEDLKPPEDSYWLQELGFRMLKVVAALDNQADKVTKEAFDDAPWMPIKSAIARLLITHSCEAGTLFLPPRLNDEA